METLDIGHLSAGAVDLDMDNESVGFLRSSIDLIERPEELHNRMQEDGYLYLPGLLNREDVKAARSEITSRLEGDGLLDPEYPAYEAMAKDGVKIMFRPDLAMNNPALDKVLYSGPLMLFYETFFGETVLHYDFTWFRAASQGTNAPPHCDIVYMGRGTFDVLTAWTPLSDIPLDHGPLMILEGSHKKRAQLEEYLSRDVDTYCVNGPDADKGKLEWTWDGSLSHDAAALRRELGGRWLTAHFRMGDVLTFTMGTVHGSINNQSKQIRLSSDSRYQKASEPADERWIGPNPIAHSAAGKRGRIC